MSETRRVTLAYPYTTEDGVTHRADTTLALPNGVAADLLWNGRAREPEKTSAAKKATAKKTAAKANAQKEQ